MSSLGLLVGHSLRSAWRGVLATGELGPAEVIGEEDVVVVGTGLFPDEVSSDDFDRLPRILATPALTTRYLADVGSYLWQGLRLAPGTERRSAIALASPVILTGWLGGLGAVLLAAALSPLAPFGAVRSITRAWVRVRSSPLMG